MTDAIKSADSTPVVENTRPPAKFTQGSTMRHVIEMTATGSIGLMAIFSVDLLTLLYISMLKDEVLTAGVGYAAVINFFAMSFNIGMMIATTALTARFIGAGDRDQARRLASSSIGWALVMALLVGFVILLSVPWLLEMIGAKGRAYTVALNFLYITLPSGPLMALGMCQSGLLRAVGDANRAMYVTLAGGISTAIFDPILIFVFDLGVMGAACVFVISRFVFAIVGWYGTSRVHDMVGKPNRANMAADAPPIFKIAIPAILTNIATPVGNAFLVRINAQFGEAAIAAIAIIDRLVPVAFGAVFALSAGVGPILSQNLGARKFDRMNSALRDALIFTFVYVLFTWMVLILARSGITSLFHATGQTAEYIVFFCYFSGLMWMFNGFLFVANAAFNNLGFPVYSTVFNWLRATIGVIPVGIYGAHLGGFKGAFIGVTFGSLVFGTAAVITAFRQVRKLGEQSVKKT